MVEIKTGDKFKVNAEGTITVIPKATETTPTKVSVTNTETNETVEYTPDEEVTADTDIKLTDGNGVEHDIKAGDKFTVKADGSIEVTKNVQQNQDPTGGAAQITEQQKLAKKLFDNKLNVPTSGQIHDVVSGDNLWNIAKNALKVANPGKTISNGEVLAYWNELKRLNPELERGKQFNMIYPGDKVKLCA